MQNRPIPYEAYLRSAEARREAWRRKVHHGRPLPRAPGPSRGHRALASLVAQGRMPAVITQNIDGLHQRSGVPAEQ
jgi:NAD-dependent deacetylase